jgi:signal transduction histidine kinase
MPELLRQVADLPADSIIYFLTMMEDGSRDKRLGVDSLDLVAAVANVPIYAWHMAGMDHGIVGGSLLSPEVLGAEVAALGLRVLGGDRPDTIPVTAFNPNVVEFDWRQLQRWNIDENRLPPNSVVRFRQPTAWQRYQAYIITGISVLVLQTVFIGALLVERARRKRNEAALWASDNEVQNLAGRLIVAQEAERTRIARDLHDDVSQQLAGISIALSNLKRRLGRQEGAEIDAQRALTSLQQRTVALAENTRYLSHDLHPGVLTHAGLVAALQRHCDELRRQHDFDVSVHADENLGSFGAEVELCLYRVAQEALQNTIRHAEASRAKVVLVRTATSAELTIADDGKGFDAARPGSRANGLGLLSINERVRVVGGAARITTELAKGLASTSVSQSPRMSISPARSYRRPPLLQTTRLQVE